MSPVAIIGIGCRFPGAHGPAEFWKLLEDKVDAIGEVPASRWDIDRYFDSDPDAPGKMSTRFGGFLDGVDYFDHQFFAISPREAVSIDPQQRLALETVWETLEDAAIDPNCLRGTNTGVFFGVSNIDYERLAVRTTEEIGPHIATGAAASIAANRISYLLDFRGPSLAVDTACSSSLVAVHLACQSLNAWESDIALAGGANLILTPHLTIAFSKARMMAPDGRCKAFDERADGYVRGEGVGFVALKRLADAVADRDPIIAVIRGTAVNQDGLSNGLTAPNPGSQAQVIERACRAAQVNPSAVEYVECHGTGTALGDPIEVEGLARTYGKNRDSARPLRIGSVKTNIGHLEAAAGIAGLIKVALALKHGLLPASLHFRHGNPHIPFDALPIAVQRDSADWPTGNEVSRAGVSSFGFGGTNAHVIVEKALEESSEAQAGADRPAHIVALSARSEDRLAAMAERYAGWLEQNLDAAIPDVAFTCNTARAQFSAASAVVGEDRRDIIRRLRDLAGRPSLLMRRRPKAQPKTAFMFSGQGSQRAGMAQVLYETEPRFRQVVDRCLQAAPAELQGDLAGSLLDAEFPQDRIDRTELAQPALFTFESALAMLWRSWGIAPDLVLGHSVGEIAAVCVAGGMTIEAGLRFAVQRGRLMQRVPERGSMIAVDVCAEASRDLEEGAFGNLEVAAYNGPDQIVLAGALGEVNQVADDLGRAGLPCRHLAVSHAFHSRLMSPALEGIENAAAEVEPNPLRLPFVANTDGGIVDTGETIDAHYWREQARKPVRFVETVETAIEAGCTVFIEIGPRSPLCGLGQRINSSNEILWAPSMVSDAEVWHKLLASLGLVWEAGVPVDWKAFDQPWSRRRISLPTYPFEPVRHWCSSDDQDPQPSRPERKLEPEAGSTVRNSTDADQSILSRVREQIAVALRTDAGKIDPSVPIAELGADSVTKVELIIWLEREFGLRLPANRFGTDVATLTDLVAFIEEAQQDERHRRPTRRPEKAQPRGAQAEERGVAGAANSRTEEPQDADFVARYTARTANSKAFAERYRPVLADRRAVAGFRPSIKELLYPIVGRRAEGAHFLDVDGNDYVDLAMGFGVQFFGHNPEFIRDALKQQIDIGFQLGPQAEFAGQVAEKIARMTATDRVAFANTGTEAVMTTIRLARAASGRDKIVSFLGAYHGHFDITLALPDGMDPNGGARPMAVGTTASAVADTIVLPYGDPEALETIRKRRHEIAAVLVEPVQSRRPEFQPFEFLETLRAITREADIALVFDEIITGFRTHQGGVQALCGIEADITTYGKLLGGGLPIGVVAGRGHWLDGVDGGYWRFGDESKPKTTLPFFAGTFNKNPLSIAAANAVLDELDKRGPELQTKLNDRCAALIKAINAALEGERAPLRAAGYSSFFRFVHQANLDAFYFGLIEKGVYLWEGRTCFLSTAHDQSDVTRILDAVAASARELAKGGSKPVGDLCGTRTPTATPAVAAACSIEREYEARLARDPSEIAAAQALRFRVFHQEMGASPKRGSNQTTLDVDLFDEFCDHLIVVDQVTEKIIGTYRLIPPEAARACGRYYSEDEYDISCLKQTGLNVLELGRACVDPDYRSGVVMQLLWKAIAEYAAERDVQIMFGCASFPGVDPESHAEALSYLARNHLAPEAFRPRAVAGRYVEMNRLPEAEIDPDRALAALPPLIRGYIRQGAWVGDGAVVDASFNTVDIAIVLKKSWR